MKRLLLLSLLALLPIFRLSADDNVATIPADRNKEGWWAQRHTAKLADPKRTEAKVVFFGDSITQGWENKGKNKEGDPNPPVAPADIWAKNFAPLGAFNLGFSGDRTEHGLWRIDNGELDGVKPKVIVILLGTNNIGHKSSTPAQTVEGMKAILARLEKKTPDAKILLLDVFPRGAKPDDDLRQQAAEISKAYAGLADGKKIVFLELGPKFLDADGNLPKDIMPDALHPNAKGYQIWVDNMLPTLNEMLK